MEKAFVPPANSEQPYPLATEEKTFSDKSALATVDANDSAAPPVASGLSDDQVGEIRAVIQTQQKFLGELLEHSHRWELEGAELRIYFATEKRPFAEMIEGRDSLEKIRVTSAKVLNRPVRVCARIEAVAATAANSSRAAVGTQELREKFERDPMVRSMLQRFGGKISEVKRREEVS